MNEEVKKESPFAVLEKKLEELKTPVEKTEEPKTDGNQART